MSPRACPRRRSMRVGSCRHDDPAYASLRLYAIRVMASDMGAIASSSGPDRGREWQRPSPVAGAARMMLLTVKTA